MGLIGLAKRAGKLSSGESACKEAIKTGKSYLIILAEDVGKNTEIGKIATLLKNTKEKKKFSK